MEQRLVQWRELADFPGYAISDEGEVLNMETDMLKVQSVNQQGIVSVNLIKDHRQHRRSVTVLVATTFLEPHYREAFDTPINLNGDRTDNRVVNLMWRPRWFAVRYHMQFATELTNGYKVGVTEVETGEEFPTLRDASTRFGLLEREMILSTMNQTRVFPTGQVFTMLF